MHMFPRLYRYFKCPARCFYGAGSPSGLTIDEDVYSTSADNAFRWDSTGKQWIFNQATGKNNPSWSQTNTIFHFQITLKDGSKINFQYGLT